ncbi:hypothetical protein B0H14DRAFT_2651190 [Mycena olivaceomarginata]|nr:hypothetical protein B0H14DRAFT_2651190 [Mycena olivaceomarginata]
MFWNLKFEQWIPVIFLQLYLQIIQDLLTIYPWGNSGLDLSTWSQYFSHWSLQHLLLPKLRKPNFISGKPVYYPENVMEVLEALNVESNHKHSGHVWLLNPWHSTSRHKTRENQDIHTMGPTQDHIEKRHSCHGGKLVYYPENVVEVLEVRGGSDETETAEALEVAGVLGASQFCIAGEKAAEVLEVDQFYIAGDADTGSKQFKPEDI